MSIILILTAKDRSSRLRKSHLQVLLKRKLYILVKNVIPVYGQDLCTGIFCVITPEKSLSGRGKKVLRKCKLRYFLVEFIISIVVKL